MVKYDIDSAAVSDYSSIAEFDIPAKDTDGVSDGSGNTTWINSDWTDQWGAFTNIPEYQNALLMKAYWNTGKGWTADPITEVTLEHISGWGKDTFDDVILNADLISMAAGDSYTQIIRAKNNQILNLKPLNPGSIKIIVKPDGRIKHYEQVSKSKKPNKIIPINEMFHLSFNRMADQIHGISKYESLKPIIQADEQSFDDMKKIMRFQAKPFVIFKMKTDNTTKINTFMTKIKEVRQKGEDLFIPDDENLLSWEVVNISPSQLIMEWRTDLRNKFYRSFGLPQIVPGGGEAGTGSESRTIYLAFEQLVAQRQLFLEKQLWNQLAIKVKFNPPTSIGDFIQDTASKEGNDKLGTQQSELNPAATKQ